MSSDSPPGDPGGGSRPQVNRDRSRSRSPHRYDDGEGVFNAVGGRKARSNHVQMNQLNSHTNQTPTSNVFQVLDSDTSEHEIVNSMNLGMARNGENHKERVPPITVFNLSITELVKHVQANVNRRVYAEDNIRYRITQHGIKVYVNNTENFKIIRKLFIDTSIHFYSHPLLEEKTIKFVMHGFHDVEEVQLGKFLEECEIYPSQISKLRINRKRYDDQSIYLLQFVYSQNMSLERLRTIRHIENVMVRFEKYAFNQSNVTQCAKCLRFSHGAKNCNLPPRCIRCGGNHASSQCDKLIDPKDPRSKIPTSQVSCANCKGKHTANYEKCSERQKYLSARQSSSATRQRNNASRQNENAPRQNARYQVPPRREQSRPRPLETQSTFDQHRPSYRNVVRDSSNLYSPSQLYQIFKKFTNALLRCKSKEEQIDTIAQMTFDLLSNDHP